MKRKFLVNIMFLLAVSIVVKAFWVLGIDRTVQNVVGETVYGNYFSLFSFSVLFTLLLDMGLSGFNNRAVSADPSRVRLWFGNVLILRLMLSAAYFLVTLTVAFALGYGQKQIELLLLLMFNQVMASMILWLRSNISGMQYLFLDSILSVADRLVMIIICSVLLWGGVAEGGFRIEWFVLAQTAAYFSVMCIAFFVVIRRGAITRLRPDTAVLRNIIVTGIPYAAVVFSMTLYWRIDSVMIERILPDGATEAGNYAQAFRLFDAFAMVPVMFGGLLLPLMTRGLALGRDIKPLAAMAGRMLMAPLGIAAVTFASFPGDILNLLYSSPSESGIDAFRLLMVALVPAGVIYIYSTMLTAAGKFRLLAAVTLSGMVINITGNWILIPRLGPAGAAAAALITQAIVALACMMAVRMTMSGVTGIGRVVSFIFMLALTFAAGWLLRRTDLSWMAAGSLQLAAGAVLALLFRFAEPLKSFKLLTDRPDSA